MAGDAAYRAKVTPQEADRTLRRIEEAGYLELRDALHPLDAGTDEWTTTLADGALTMASFLKPISRTRAEALLQGVLDRAALYNVDEVKSFVISQLIVFGSLLPDGVAELGDLDLGVRFAEQRPDSASAEALLAHARQSGRRFANFVDTIGWAQNELLQLLRNRSPTSTSTPRTSRRSPPAGRSSTPTSPGRRSARPGRAAPRGSRPPQSRGVRGSPRTSFAYILPTYGSGPCTPSLVIMALTCDDPCSGGRI